MRNNNRFGRRKVLLSGAAGIGTALVPSIGSASTAQVDEMNEILSTSPDNDPMNVYLSNNQLEVDTSPVPWGLPAQGDFQQQDYDGGGSEVSTEDIEEAVNELNSAHSSGDVDLFAYMSDPPIPMVDYEPNSGVMEKPEEIGSNNHNCNTSNEFEWWTTWMTNRIDITLDYDTANQIASMLAAGAGTAAVVGAITASTGVGAVPGWVSVAIGALLGYWAGDLHLNIGDCGVVQEVTVYGGLPVPFYSFEPIHH